jgi:hypothetical protein
LLSVIEKHHAEALAKATAAAAASAPPPPPTITNAQLDTLQARLHAMHEAVRKKTKTLTRRKDYS